VVVPTGDFVLHDGDHVILFAMVEKLEEVEGLFRQRSDESRG
jgi:Trk K+ transport system NAD-binding subunit